MTFELILTDEQEIPAELLELETRAINHARLHADLTAALGGLIAGISMRAGHVAVLLTGIPDELQQNEAESIVAAHDSAQLTTEQQAEALRHQIETDAKPLAVSALQAYSSVMADLTDNWTALAAGAKLEAVRVGVIVALRLARYLAARLLA